MPRPVKEAGQEEHKPTAEVTPPKGHAGGERREVRQTRRKLARMIAAGGYSREELNAALDDLAVKEAKAKAASRPMVLALLAKLRPGERLHFLSVFMPYLDNVQNHPEIMWQ